MKTLKSLLGLIALLTVASCAKTVTETEGCVHFAICTDQVLADITRSNVSDYTSLPDAADFVLTITDAEGSVFWNGTVSEWDPATRIKAGEYSVRAVYGDIEDEGFDKPCFEGVQTFTVKGKETSQVEISASLANTLIMVNCTDRLKNYYKDYTFSLERNNTRIVTFAKGESRAAFVDGYKITVTGVLISETGAEKTFSQEYSGLSSATAYNMLFDVSGTGSSAITITFNNTVGTIDLGDVELND